MTYVEAISEIQKRSINALKVVQSTQIASLVATRDLTAALVTPPLGFFGVSPLVCAMTNLTRSLAFQLLDQQIACAKSVTETLIGPMRAPSPAADQPFAFAAVAALEAAPLGAETPMLATAFDRIETIDDVAETPMPATAFDTIETLDDVEKTDAASRNSSAPDQTHDSSLGSTHETVALQPEAAEPPQSTLETANVPLHGATRQLLQPPEAPGEPVDLKSGASADGPTAAVPAQALPPPNVVKSKPARTPKTSGRSKRRPGK